MDEHVNRLLDLDVRREVAVALVPVGYALGITNGPSLEIGPLELKAIPVSNYEIDFPAIREMHEASSLVRRGSPRQFSQAPITFAELSTILYTAAQRIPADYANPQTSPLNDMYLIVNSVDGLRSGCYLYHRESKTLELTRQGEFRHEAGLLALNQALGADAAINVFFLTDLKGHCTGSAIAGTELRHWTPASRRAECILRRMPWNRVLRGSRSTMTQWWTSFRPTPRAKMSCSWWSSVDGPGGGNHGKSGQSAAFGEYVHQTVCDSRPVAGC